MQSMRLLLLIFAHHRYLTETVAEGERGKTTELTSYGYQRKLLIVFMSILFFHQHFQDTIWGELSTVGAIQTEWHVGGMG